MNGLVVAFLAASVVMVFTLPRRLALLPILMGCCYIPFGPELTLGPFHFNAIRVLIAAGAVRATVRGEWWTGGFNSIDRWLLLWAAWLIASSAFHKDLGGTLVFRLGLAYDACGIYFLVRSACRSVDDLVTLCKLTAVVLVPVGIGMLYEKVTVHNVFSVFGGVGDSPMIREGHVRAQGPFAHPILAGTIGGVCLPLMIGLWNIARARARLGILACLMIVFSSASSGPILSAATGVFALYIWRHRKRVRQLQWMAVFAYLFLEVVMKDPPYFLIARVDLAGGSTSWYRARLIQSAFEHLSEWWLVGTDYTRSWMWVVVSWSQDNTDITSHYIQMGVWGGLPLMILFMIVLSRGFKGIAATLQRAGEVSAEKQFLLWSFGGCLFAHTTTMWSVSYFDQSFMFLYLPLAAIGSAWSATALTLSTEPVSTTAGSTRGLVRWASPRGRTLPGVLSHPKPGVALSIRGRRDLVGPYGRIGTHFGERSAPGVREGSRNIPRGSR